MTNMKVISLVLSIITFVYLLTSLEHSDNHSRQANDGIENKAVFYPKQLSNTHLAIEQTWQENKKQSLVNKNNQNKTAKNEKTKTKRFQLGEQSFSLLGIFNNKVAPFVLLKDENEKLIKLSKGNQLNDSVKLIALNSDSIVFEVENNTVEFKLFERKN